MELRVTGKQFEMGEVLPEKVRLRLQSVMGSISTPARKAMWCFRMKALASARTA
jgi:hypothetical protein